MTDMERTSPILEHEADIYFERGGPVYRLMQRIGVIKGEGPSLGRRFFFFILITWVPLLIFSLLEGRAMGPTPRQSFLLDFATYARSFLAVPLLFIAEAVVGPRFTEAGRYFVRTGLVRPEYLPAFDAAVVKVRRRREALLPELLVLGAAFLGAWLMSTENWYAGKSASWNSLALDGGSRVSLAGLWYHIVSVPVLQFFGLRWLWRLTVWTLFLWDVSRLKLQLIATHPDQAGGLGILGIAHSALWVIALSFSCILSADAGFRIYFESADIRMFEMPFVAYVVIIELVFLGPLLIFTPLLARTRRDGLTEYGALADTYNRSFDEKWVENGTPAGEPLLGSADIQSLADLGNTFEMIRQMLPFPFTKWQVLLLAATAALPSLPLIFLVMPVPEFLNVIARALL